MQTSLRHSIVLVSVWLGALSIAAAREASVKRNVNLRSDPSTGSPAIELIQAKSTVTLLDPAPQNGYYHVKAADGQEGWVWGKNISLGAETGGPSTRPATPPSTPTSPSTGRQGPPELYPDAVRTPGVPNPDSTQSTIAEILSK